MSDARDFVVGIDSSTQSTKAIAWTREGAPVAEGRAAVAISNPRLYWFEQDSDAWWSACCTALRALTGQIDPARVAGVAIANQRETMAFLDEDFRPVRPAMLWLDERARAEVPELAAEIGPKLIHELTGRPVDIIPCLYRIRWLAKHEPEAFARTRWFADVQACLVKGLTGRLRSGWLSADPLGLFDIRAKVWAGELLDALGIGPERLPEVEPPGGLLGEVSATGAAATGLRAGTPVFAGGGDGQCAALGTNTTRPGQAYLNLGTAMVGGVWSADCRNDPGWRTELAADGAGYILETCLRSGAFLINWFVDNFVPKPVDGASVFDRLEQEAADIPLGCDGLLTLPYWSGVMNPHWDDKARGILIGLAGGHAPAHVYRSMLEGMTLEQVDGFAGIERVTGVPITVVLAIGGGATSRLWPQMLADALGRLVALGDTVEASSLGAAMVAAYGAGWYPSIRAAGAAMAGRVVRTVEPDPTAAAGWAELASIYRELYRNNAATCARLVAFASNQRAAG
jgi:xylulokinase